MSHGSHGTTPIGPHRSPAEHEQGFNPNGSPFEPRILSPELEPLLNNPNLSDTPKRMARGSEDVVWSGTKASLPSWDTLSAARVDDLLLRRPAESTEAYEGRLPKKFLRLRSFVVGTQVKISEIRSRKNDELEVEAAKMLHAADTITRARRSRRPGAKLERDAEGKITDRIDRETGDLSSVTSSKWYRERTRKDGVEPTIVAHRGSESRRVKRMARDNRQRRKYAYEAKHMRRAVQLLDGVPDSALSRKQIRNRNRNAKVAHHAAHIAGGYINGRKVFKVIPRKGILQIASEKALEVQENNKKLEKAQSKKAALTRAVGLKQEEKAEARAEKQARRAERKDAKQQRREEKRRGRSEERSASTPDVPPVTPSTTERISSVKKRRVTNPPANPAPTVFPSIDTATLPVASESDMHAESLGLKNGDILVKLKDGTVVTGGRIVESRSGIVKKPDGTETPSIGYRVEIIVNGAVETRWATAQQLKNWSEPKAPKPTTN
jgi:Skp family chaperone for outer membrane proteins